MKANSHAAASPSSRGSVIARASSAIHWFEIKVLQILTFLLAFIFVVNVPLNALGRPIYWAGEVGVNIMAVAAAIGASALVARAEHPAVNILGELVPATIWRYVEVVSNVLILAFALTLIVFAYYWFDPVGLWHYRNQPDAYAIETGNFLYRQTLNTLAVQQFWFWLVWPVSGLFMALHALEKVRLSILNILAHKEQP